MTTEEQTVIQALEKRQDYILANLENMTMKGLRRVLEQDLLLEKDALKPMKKVVSGFVDKLLSDARSVPFGKEKDKEGRSATPGQSTEARKGRELSERFVRMRNICKQATITIPPSVYRKDCNDNDMEAAILELLKKNGLDEKSQKSSIMAVKEKLQLQRDLDGIDTSNIIDDGPRSRRRAVRYVKEDSVSQGEEDFSGEEESNDNISSEGNSSDQSSEEVPLSASKPKRPKIDEWSDDE